jgi:hypothetical protein
MPTVDVPVAPAGDPSVRRLTPPDVAPATAGPAIGWEPKPVAVLAIKTTWLDRSEAGARPDEPRTLASRWEERLAEKVTGFGGIIPQGARSLCLVAFR